MIAVFRLMFLFLFACGGFYGFLRLLFCTSYFKDSARLKRIARRTLFLIISVFVAAMLMLFFVAADRMY